nr:hypothetical protein [uncultured Gellertiella sp.]
MRGLLLSSLMLAALASPVLADSRYGCMAGDSSLKLAIHLEFSEELGGRLSHLSGVLAVGPEAARPDLAEVRLTSAMITQVWADRQQVLVRIFDDKVKGEPLVMTIATRARSDEAATFDGTYMLSQKDQKGPGFHLEGALFCQIDTVAALAN